MFWKTCFLLVLKLARTNKALKEGIIDKYDILTVQEKIQVHRGTETKISLEMILLHRDNNALRLKTAKI